MMKLGTTLGLAAIVIVGAIVANFTLRHDSTLPEQLYDVAVFPPQSLEAVDLIDQNNEVVGIERFKNNWTFLFVGFTHCAHICVPSLSQMVLLKKAILNQPEFGPRYQEKGLAFVFVSVDPARDTPEHLARYMGSFDPGFIGMTGEESAVEDFEKRLKALHRVREDKTKPQGYDIDHSGEIFLIDPAGRLAAKFHPPLDINKVVNQFQLFVGHFTAPVPPG